jgi:uncharacterized protein with PIN domain
MCGYDTVYAHDVGHEADTELQSFATRTDRTILTRDTDLADGCEDAVLLESRTTETMLSTLDDAGFELTLPEIPTYCSTCNGQLEGVAPDDQTPEYAPSPVSTDIWQCTDCGQFFWKGSHWDDVAETLGSL